MKTAITLIITLAAAAMASGQTARSAVDCIPALTVAVVSVNWRSARLDRDLRKIVNGDDFPTVAKQLGVDERSVSEFIIFADATPTTANKLGMIIAGRFTVNDIVRNATSRGWTREAVGRRTAYRNPIDGSLTLALRPGLLVAGTPNGVHRTAETYDASRTGLARKRDFSAIYAQMGSRTPIRLFVGMPQEYQLTAKIGYFVLKKLVGIGFFSPLGIALTAIGLIQSVGVSFAAGDANVPVHVVAQMAGPVRAGLVSSGLNMLKKTALTLPNTSAADAEAMRAMTVSNTGRYLSLKMQIPRRQLFPVN